MISSIQISHLQFIQKTKFTEKDSGSLKRVHPDHNFKMA